MVISMVFFMAAAGLAAYLVVRRQTVIISSLRAELIAVGNELELVRSEGQKELERLEAANDRLDRENDKLDNECKLRREYAYVCRDCKQADPNVQAARERNLRSVTGGPKR